MEIMAKGQVASLSPVLIILIVLAVVGGGGYFLIQSGKLSGPASSLPGASLFIPKATEKDFAFIEDPLIRKHFAAQANVTAFRSRSHDLIAQAGSYNVFEVQAQGDDAAFYNWHEDDGKKNGELISIGNTTYVKDYKDGAWWKQTLKPEEKPKNEDEGAREPQNFEEEYKEDRKLTYQKLGEEACGPSTGSGLTCYKYKEVDPKNPEASRIFWFDKGKFLLRREESGFGEWRAAIEYSYDGINIRVPSPTKEVPEGKNIYEYLYPGAPGATNEKF